MLNRTHQPCKRRNNGDSIRRTSLKRILLQCIALQCVLCCVDAWKPGDKVLLDCDLKIHDRTFKKEGEIYGIVAMSPQDISRIYMKDGSMCGGVYLIEQNEKNGPDEQYVAVKLEFPLKGLYVAVLASDLQRDLLETPDVADPFDVDGFVCLTPELVQDDNMQAWYHKKLIEFHNDLGEKPVHSKARGYVKEIIRALKMLNSSPELSEARNPRYVMLFEHEGKLSIEEAKIVGIALSCFVKDPAYSDTGFRCHIDRLVAFPQRNGHGKALMTVAEHFFRTEKTGSEIVLTLVDGSKRDKNSRGFYDRCGFVEDVRSKKDAASYPDMVKILPPSALPKFAEVAEQVAKIRGAARARAIRYLSKAIPLETSKTNPLDIAAAGIAAHSERHRYLIIRRIYNTWANQGHAPAWMEEYLCGESSAWGPPPGTPTGPCGIVDLTDLKRNEY